MTIQPSEYRDNGWGDSGNIHFRSPVNKNSTYIGGSQAHTHSATDSGHTHSVVDSIE